MYWITPTHPIYHPIHHPIQVRKLNVPVSPQFNFCDFMVKPTKVRRVEHLGFAEWWILHGERSHCHQGEPVAAHDWSSEPGIQVDQEHGDQKCMFVIIHSMQLDHYYNINKTVQHMYTMLTIHILHITI